MENKNKLNLNAETEDILGLMKNYELILKKLYELFAQKIPQEREFWLKLSEEENKHAYWLEILDMNLKKQEVILDDNSIDAAAVKSSFADVQKSIEYFNKTDVVSKEALKLAVSLENHMIEQDFFESSHGQIKDFDQTMNLLREETLRHGEVLRQKLIDESGDNSDDRSESLFDKIKRMF